MVRIYVKREHGWELVDMCSWKDRYESVMLLVRKYGHDNVRVES
jgi:hypothetical protein